jgi:hypothetical protein
MVPSVIKIDVEGAELLVLKGAGRLLQEVRPQLIVGVHPYWLPESQDAEQIFRLLETYGYKIRDELVLPFDGTFLADYWFVPR